MQQPWLETLRWLRVVGDVVFSVGVGVLAWFVLGLFTGRSFENAEHPLTCSFCSQWKVWRTYRTRTPKDFVDEIEDLVKAHRVGFFILADEEPTIHQKKFVALCEELIDRDLGIPWGINTWVQDILRDEELLPLYRKAGPPPLPPGRGR